MSKESAGFALLGRQIELDDEMIDFLHDCGWTDSRCVTDGFSFWMQETGKTRMAATTPIDAIRLELNIP